MKTSVSLLVLLLAFSMDANSTRADAQFPSFLQCENGLIPGKENSRQANCYRAMANCFHNNLDEDILVSGEKLILSNRVTGAVRVLSPSGSVGIGDRSSAQRRASARPNSSRRNQRSGLSCRTSRGDSIGEYFDQGVERAESFFKEKASFIKEKAQDILSKLESGEMDLKRATNLFGILDREMTGMNIRKNALSNCVAVNGSTDEEKALSKKVVDASADWYPDEVAAHASYMVLLGRLGEMTQRSHQSKPIGRPVNLPQRLGPGGTRTYPGEKERSQGTAI